MDYKRLMYALIKYKEDKNNKHTLKLSADTLTRMGKFVAAIPRENFLSHLHGTELVTASDGETMDRVQLACFIGIICRFVPSFFIAFKGPQVQDTKYSSPVPYILYMHKLHNGTMYNEWKDTNAVILGPHFKDLHADMNQIRSLDLSWSTDEKMKLREMGLIWAGKVVPATGYNMKKTGIDEHFDKLSKNTRMMLLQTWCHNTVNRNKYMINDPLDWDLMPDTLDELAQQPTKETMPWEDLI